MSVFTCDIDANRRRAFPNSRHFIPNQPLYPEALARKTERRRQDWHRAYLDTIVERDIPDIATIVRPGQVPALLQITAQYAGQLTNMSEIGRGIALDHKTTESYIRVLDQLFLLRRIQPWSRNELSRVVKTPKLHFLDAGLLTAMRGYSPRWRTDAFICRQFALCADSNAMVMIEQHCPEN